MSGTGRPVGPLSKVSALLEAGTDPDKTDLTPGPVPFEFIYGAGSGGLAPIESRLAGKTEGQSLVLPVKEDELPTLFQHLPLPPLTIPESAGAFYLKVKILRVSDADPREVIKAMAETGSCGDHCCGH